MGSTMKVHGDVRASCCPSSPKKSASGSRASSSCRKKRCTARSYSVTRSAGPFFSWVAVVTSLALRTNSPARRTISMMLSSIALTS